MKYIIRTTILITFFIFDIAFAQSDIKIAVMDIFVSGRTPESQKAVLSNRIRSELMNTGLLDVMDRQTMVDLLFEQGYPMTDCRSDACTILIGSVIQVDRMVVGSLEMNEDLTLLTLKVIDVKSSEVLSTGNTSCSCTFEQFLNSNIHDIVQQISGLTSSKVERGGIASLMILGAPPGTEVFIDDESVGNVDDLIRNIPAGKHRITTTNPEYSSYETTSDLSNQNVNIVEVFMLKMSTLSINVTPDSTLITIDGADHREDIAPVTYTDLPSGEYYITATLPYHKTWTDTIFLGAGSKKSLSGDLGGLLRELYINSNISRGNLSINGEISKQEFPCTIKDIQPGDYEIEITARNHDPFSTRITIEKPGQTAIEAHLEQDMGTLALAHLPPGIDVYIDKKLIGRTPLPNREIGVGIYPVELKQRGYEKGGINTIKIKQDQITNVSNDLVPKTRLKAFGKSLRWPGAGQTYLEREDAGKKYIYGEAVFIAYVIYSAIDNRLKLKKYLNTDSRYSELILEEEIKSEYDKKRAAYDSAHNAQTRFNIAFTLAIGYYLFNLIDFWIFEGDTPDAYSIDDKSSPVYNFSVKNLNSMSDNPVLGIGCNISFDVVRGFK
ncbi:MAG: PEGA domain-containing protein [Candidatus Electryonea clarkiae]|nr:PEGA domain-containing protein [Candidatus Electryonea clarkiae]MDP8288452.1 PEGA domain-containing protein [Candidatus Electryonea clarkiae]